MLPRFHSIKHNHFLLHPSNFNFQSHFQILLLSVEITICGACGLGKIRIPYDGILTATDSDTSRSRGPEHKHVLGDVQRVNIHEPRKVAIALLN